MSTSTDIRGAGRVVSAVRRALAALDADATLLACVSGGADSVALLHALCALGANVEVANCNFHLRGAESDRDSEFVARLCDTLGVPLHRFDFDTRDYCARHRTSIELGCRELRYAAFRRLREERGFARIVVAHNADDNIETLFLNLLRGTGLRGLCGMEPDTGEILRPLLDVPRREIEEYLNTIGAEHVMDSSNTDDDYRRNFLRLRVIPLLESRWPGLRRAISTTIDNLRGAESVYEKSIADALGADRGFVSREILEAFPSSRDLLHAAFAGKGASPSQLREMEQTERAGAQWRLPHGTVCLQKEGFRYVEDCDMPSPELFSVEKFRLSETLFRHIVANADDNSSIWLPGDFSLYFWMTPEPGMRISPLGMCGSRKIVNMLRDARVPAPLRRSYPLLVEKASGKVVWVPGVRRSRYATVDKKCKTVIKISIIEQNENG